jgi:sensor histidine kinase YesM
MTKNKSKWNWTNFFNTLKESYVLICMLTVPLVVIGFLIIAIQVSYWNFFVLLVTAGSGMIFWFLILYQAHLEMNSLIKRINKLEKLNEEKK